MDHIYWIIGGISATGAALLAIVYGLGIKNSNKIAEHDIMFAKLDKMPAALEDLTEKVDKLVVSVAIIRNSCMYVPHNNHKIEND